MRVIITSSQRFLRTPDGRVWTGASYSYGFWQRYLDVYDEVVVVSRAQNVTDVPPDAHEVSGPRVSFLSLPHYIGPWQFLTKVPEISRITKRVSSHEDAFIFRGADLPFRSLRESLIRQGRPFGVEVIGDPFEVFAPGAMRHPLREVFRLGATAELRRFTQNATAVSYVNDRVLPDRYPSRDSAFRTIYSSIELTDPHFALHSRSPSNLSGPVRLITVGSLAQRYKGVDVLLDAMALLVRSGLSIRLSVVGEGRYKRELISQSHELGIASHVEFLGHVPAGDKVREQLDASDIFVLASRTEGLPRAMIEAMARGLPCVGTRVGGIPELLPTEMTVEPDKPDALAGTIASVVKDPVAMREASEKNLSAARRYHRENIRPRRIEMYSFLRKATERWIEAQNP